MADQHDEQATAVHRTQPEAEPQAAGEAAAQPQGQPEQQPGPETVQRTEVFFSRDEAQQTVQAPTPPPPQEQAQQGATSPAEADRMAADEKDSFAEKPHLYVLGAFAGAFAAAQVLKWVFGGGDE